MTAAEHLAQYGVTVQDARNFILSNLSNITFVFNTCYEYGVTADMVAEILADDYPGITTEIVLGVLSAVGLDADRLAPAQNQLLDDQGRPIAEEVDRDGDGVIDTKISYEYLEDGSYYRYIDFDMDSSIQYKQLFSADKKLQYQWADTDTDGTFDVERMFEYSTDGSYVEFIDNDGDGVFDAYSEHDTNGQYFAHYEDRDGDGRFEFRITLDTDTTSWKPLSTYLDQDGDGNYETWYTKFEHAADGSYRAYGDNNFDGYFERYWQYDVNGQTVERYRDKTGDGRYDEYWVVNSTGQRLEEYIDGNGDGVYDYFIEYDPSGNDVRLKEWRDTDGDGIFETMHGYYEYLDGGDYFFYHDYDQDNNFEVRDTFNENGNRILTHFDTDLDGDYDEYHFFDDSGNTIEAFIDTDDNATFETQKVYNADGSYDLSIDPDGDGVYNYIGTYFQDGSGSLGILG